MKFDLFTKSILTVIAVLLGLNLLFMTDIFSTKKVSASNNSILQIGKIYSFSKDYDQLGFGKLLAADENGWVKLLQPANQTYPERIILVNTNRATTGLESEEKK